LNPWALSEAVYVKRPSPLSKDVASRHSPSPSKSTIDDSHLSQSDRIAYRKTGGYLHSDWCITYLLLLLTYYFLPLLILTTTLLYCCRRHFPRVRLAWVGAVGPGPFEIPLCCFLRLGPRKEDEEGEGQRDRARFGSGCRSWGRGRGRGGGRGGGIVLALGSGS